MPRHNYQEDDEYYQEDDEYTYRPARRIREIERKPKKDGFPKDIAFVAVVISLVIVYMLANVDWSRPLSDLLRLPRIGRSR